MVLMLPPVRSGYLSASNNFAATPGTAASRGSTITSGSANVKGSWTELIASTPFEVAGFAISGGGASSGSAERHALIDIGIGAASSEVVICSNACVSTITTNLTNSPSPPEMFFPIRVKAGTRIAARHQNSFGGQNAYLLVTLYGGFSEPPWRTFSGADCLGADTGTSKIVALTAGNSGSESSWTNIGSTTTRPYQAVQVLVSTDTSTAVTNLTYHVEWGWNSTTMGETFFQASQIEAIGCVSPTVPNFAWVPTGTQLQARAECSGTGESLEYGLLCFY